MNARWVSLSALVLLAGCSEQSAGVYDEAQSGSAEVQKIVAEPPAGSPEFGLKQATEGDAAAGAEATAGEEEAKPAAPLPQQRIAYTYSIGYELDADEIGPAQTAHMALCDKLGAARCRIKSMERGSSAGDFASASLNLAVDATAARSFQTDLDKAVDAAGGELASRGIEAEDLAKQMVDADARIKAKQALADRLMGVIKSRSGSVADLVAAERAFAEAQEELEAARSWMAEMQTRVALSDVDIRYTSVGPVGSGWLRPVGLALREAGTILGESMGTLIRFIVAVLPWLLALTALVWLWKRRGWRTPWPARWRRKAAQEEDQSG